jgi:hypothetical protein
MAAAEITPKVYNKQGSVPVVGRFLKATTADWIVLPYPGAHNIQGSLYTGADEDTLTNGTAVVNNKGSAYTAATTQIVVDAGIITRQAPYYVQAGAIAGGEIMLVVSETAADNAASTLTVIRGCLGTTPAAASVADDVVLYIKNIIVWGKATTGYVDFSFIPMSAEPKSKYFA